MFDWLTLESLGAFFSVVMVDLVLAGDNAIVIGMAAAGLPDHLRRRAIVLGILAATVLRIVFAATTMKLLTIIGLTLAGGLLLLWVSWKMWRELRVAAPEVEVVSGAALAEGSAGDAAGGMAAGAAIEGGSTVAATATREKTLTQAMIQIVVADVSMSLDNVLAVAGAARDHLWVLIFGLVLSIALMGFASTIVARLLGRYHWLAYVGLAIIFFVACDMIWRGALELL